MGLRKSSHLLHANVHLCVEVKSSLGKGLRQKGRFSIKTKEVSLKKYYFLLFLIRGFKGFRISDRLSRPVSWCGERIYVRKVILTAFRKLLRRKGLQLHWMENEALGSVTPCRGECYIAKKFSYLERGGRSRLESQRSGRSENLKAQKT